MRLVLAPFLLGIPIAASVLGFACSTPKGTPSQSAFDRPTPNIEIVLPNPQNRFDVQLKIADGPGPRERAVDVYLLWDRDKLDAHDGWGRKLDRFEGFEGLARTKWTVTLDGAGNYRSPGFLLRPREDVSPPYTVRAEYAYQGRREERARAAHVIATGPTPAEMLALQPLTAGSPPLVPVNIRISPPNPGSGMFTAVLTLMADSPLSTAVFDGYDVYLCWVGAEYDQPTGPPGCTTHGSHESRIWPRICQGVTGPCNWSSPVDFQCTVGARRPRYVYAHVRFAAGALDLDLDTLTDDNNCP